MPLNRLILARNNGESIQVGQIQASFEEEQATDETGSGPFDDHLSKAIGSFKINREIVIAVG